MTARDCLTGKNAPKMFGPAINVRHFRPNASDRRTSKKIGEKDKHVAKNWTDFYSKKEINGSVQNSKMCIRLHFGRAKKFQPAVKSKIF